MEREKMKAKWMTCLALILLFLSQYCSISFAQTDKDPAVKYQNNSLIITNHSQKMFNLRQASIQFNYFGRVFKISNAADPKQKIKFSVQDMSQSNGNRVYTAKIYGTKNIILQPEQSLKLALLTDKKDIPHDFKVKAAPTPVNVTVSVANANWVETISICNTSGASIPLNNIEFDFNYSVPMPANIWGIPWAAWKVASQNGNQVVLVGGTPFTPALPSDPNCMNPLTIQFNAPPSTPQPTGPFVFKAEGGVPSNVGNLNIILTASPAAGLPNPTLTLAGPGTNQQKVVTWGTTWALTNLAVGNYTIKGATVTANGQNYTANPVTAVVNNQQTTNATITYQRAATSGVMVTLVNAPIAQVPLTLTGVNATFNQTVTNGSVLNLPNDSYAVTSNVSGYNAVATPNPLVVPNNSNLSISYSPISSGGPGSRTVNFVNQCPFPVWFGFISGATKNKNGEETCNVDADCWPNNTCVDRGGGGKHCFWTNPIPANNNFRLAPNGGTNSVLIPFVQTPLNAVFSGAAAGRTNCTAAGCETGDCGAGTGGCPPGKGFMQPATQAEFTFNTNQNDFYDVEAVNGMNIPVSMAPISGLTNPNDPYFCGTPGAVTTNSQMGPCSWNFTPTRVEFNWVRAGGAACTSNANCQAGTVCGLSFNPGHNPLLQKTCGKLLGYWNANQICGVQNNYGEPFNCQQQLPAPNQAFKVFNLLGCAPIPSCYQDGAGNNCCGCVNWDQVGVQVPPAPFTKQCVNSNVFWKTNVMPDLKWIKQACPSIYTFPFDDQSSTFQCQVMQNNNGTPVNSVGYTITFCPGGKTGGVTA